MNFEYFTYYIITAFSQTATTFTSQNYAAGQRDGAGTSCGCVLGCLQCAARSRFLLSSGSAARFPRFLRRKPP